MKKIEIQILFIVVALIAATEIGLSLAYKAHPMFYRAQSESALGFEESHQLFAEVDPLLGYAHNSAFVPSEKDKALGIGLNSNEMTDLRNGFVKMSFQGEDPKALKIAILGSSGTEPFLNSGSWPLSLHRKLSEKNISHIIYNGAVSGYNSQQILTKLVRDVFRLDKMSAIIVYSGAVDSERSGDVVNEHPAIHPYQKYLFDLAVGNSTTTKNSWILPNIQWFVSKLKARMLPDVALQMGIKNDDYAGHFTTYVKYMRAVCEVQEVLFFHFLEAYAETPAQILAAPGMDTGDSSSAKQRQIQFLKEARAGLSELKYSFSLQEKMPKDQKVFFNLTLPAPLGSDILAENVMNEILRDK